MFNKLVGNVNRWLSGGPRDGRRAPRFNVPSIFVHYWDGSAPEGRKIRDISDTGAFITTTENWYPGTIVRLILQGHKDLSQDRQGEDPSPSTTTTTISARVVRQEPGGVAVEFLFPTVKERDALERFLVTIPKTPSLEKSVSSAS